VVAVVVDQRIIEMWRKRLGGVRFDPPIDYKLIFNDAVKGLAKPEYSFLDIGTGTGRVIFENNLQDRYGTVIGVDIRPEMVNLCKEKAKGMKNVDFIAMDATKRMKLNPGSFDVIASMFGPHDPAEVFRLLSPGGYFVYIDSILGDHMEIVRRFPDLANDSEGNPRLTTIKERNKRFKAAGLEVVSTNALSYKWIFKNEEALRQFYEKILFAPVFDGKEEALHGMDHLIDGSIRVTRRICTTVARKV
jgi:SAM-dependent methyltransferase